jgi:predicted dehydrogenase
MNPPQWPAHRWGIVGPGGIASRFAEDMPLATGGELGAVASRSMDRANAFADKFGIPSRYADPLALAADPDITVVYVATPHSRHAADTIRLLEAGKHVLCEKPFALNAGQVRRMIDAARANDRFLMEAMWSRFLPAYRTLVSTVEAGTIGEPLLVESDFGFRVPVMPDHRLFDPRLGGGALLDIGVYPLQLCSLVLGTPDEVVAGATVGSTGVDEQVAAILRYGAHRLGVVKASLRVATGCTARISGTEGWIELPRFMHHPHSIVIGTGDTGERVDTSFDGHGLHFEITEVHRCLDAGLLESPLMPLSESAALAATTDAIREQVGVVYPGD